MDHVITRLEYQSFKKECSVVLDRGKLNTDVGITGMGGSFCDSGESRRTSGVSTGLISRGPFESLNQGY